MNSAILTAFLCTVTYYIIDGHLKLKIFDPVPLPATAILRQTKKKNY